jgi:hypothetical protein
MGRMRDGRPESTAGNAAAPGRVHLASMADGAVSHAEVGGLSLDGGLGWFRLAAKVC